MILGDAVAMHDDHDVLANKELHSVQPKIQLFYYQYHFITIIL